MIFRITSASILISFLSFSPLTLMCIYPLFLWAPLSTCCLIFSPNSTPLLHSTDFQTAHLPFWGVRTSWHFSHQPLRFKAASLDSWNLNSELWHCAAWTGLRSNGSFQHSPWPIKHSVGGEIIGFCADAHTIFRLALKIQSSCTLMAMHKWGSLHVHTHTHPLLCSVH